MALTVKQKAAAGAVAAVSVAAAGLGAVSVLQERDPGRAAAPSATSTTSASGGSVPPGPSPSIEPPAPAGPPPPSPQPSAPSPEPPAGEPSLGAGVKKVDAVDTGQSFTAEEVGTRLVALTNQYRASRGLSQLQPSDTLTAAAQQWSQAMVASNSFGHNPAFPDNLAGGIFWAVGENLASNFTAEGILNSLIASPEHHQNLIRPEFTHIGVGVVRQTTGPYAGQFWTTQLLGAS